MQRQCTLEFVKKWLTKLKKNKLNIKTFKNTNVYSNFYNNKTNLNMNLLNSVNYLFQMNTVQSLRFRSKLHVKSNAKNIIQPTSATVEWQSAKTFEEMPTLSGFSMIRNFLTGGKYNNLDVTQFLLALKEDLGSICRLKGVCGQTEMVYTHNSQDFEKVLRNAGTWPKRPGMEILHYHRTIHRAEFFQGFEGLLSTQDEKWSLFRSAVNPVLMQPKTVRLYLPKLSLINRKFVKRIREIRDSKTLEVPSTFEEEINRLTLESVSVVALNQHLGLINESRNNPRAKLLFTTLNEFISLSLDMEIKPSIWRYYKTPTFKKAMYCLDSLLEVATFYIDQAIERLDQECRNGQERPEHEKSVLEKLIQIDKKIAVVMAIDMLMSGVDTTSSSFAGILLSLAKNPDKQAKLRQEIMNILPFKDSEFNEKAYQNMPYLRACIKESFRYYPITVGNSRAPINDIVLSGYRVPKGTHVTMLTISLLRDEKHFALPNEYLPERWLRTPKENVENDSSISDNLKPSCPFIYLPFGFGARTCIGRRLVELELELGIARLVRNFHIEFNYPTENAFKSVLINMPNIPLKFKFTDVKC